MPATMASFTLQHSMASPWSPSVPTETSWRSPTSTVACMLTPPAASTVSFEAVSASSVTVREASGDAVETSWGESADARYVGYVGGALTPVPDRRTGCVSEREQARPLERPALAQGQHVERLLLRRVDGDAEEGAVERALGLPHLLLHHPPPFFCCSHEISVP